MLQFLLKRLPNIKQRHRFLCKTILLSAAGHCLVALIALLIARFSSWHVFVLNKEGMHKYGRIMLIPLARRIAPNILLDKQKEDTESMQQEISKIETQEKQEKRALTEFVENQNIVENFQHVDTQIEEFADKSQLEQSQTISQKEQPAQTAKDEITYVGREDLHELKLYKTVFNAIEKEWRPPVGLPADSACEIAFIVKEGKAHNIEILKSSKIAAYDIAARCAVSRAYFERQAYGKRCTVVFKL